jgi:Thymidylate synthase complementing protein
MKYIRIAVPDDFDDALAGVKIEYPVINADYPDPPDYKSSYADIFRPKYHDVLDKGFIGLVDFMGSDQSIVNAARVSYGTGTKRVSEDPGLIRYLIRNRHWSPVEMVDTGPHQSTNTRVATRSCPTTCICLIWRR